MAFRLAPGSVCPGRMHDFLKIKDEDSFLLNSIRLLIKWELIST